MILALAAIIAGGIFLTRPSENQNRIEFWTFAKNHYSNYEPAIQEWNRTAPHPVYQLLLSGDALERRMLSGFFSGTPVADLIEVEATMVTKTFAGPLESVGFTDLTDRLISEGIMDQINSPSFSQWTSRGRIFGIPHDVHPVLLAYRSDLIEGAGIDVSKIETWDDFIRLLLPLTKQGKERYLLQLSPQSGPSFEMLLAQAGGGFFDEKDHPTMASEINVKTLATLVSWCAGPDAIGTEVTDFSAGGYELLSDGLVLAALMPDWKTRFWKGDIPKMAGKWKLMPLPAWTKGGRRTSVAGGTMLAIPKSTKHFDEAWAMAKELYLSPKLSRRLYLDGDIVTPVKSNWNDPIYDTPDPYFSGQPKGRLYINQCPFVPHRPSSPFAVLARNRFTDASVSLYDFAKTQKRFTPASLEDQARILLLKAQEQVEIQMRRNVFLAP